MSHIDEHGRRVFVGQEAINEFSRRVSRLMENRKLHYRTTFQDLPISVENRKGSIRRGVDPDGKEWATKHKAPYGYIPGTEGPDGDAVDVFVGSNPDAAYAYVIHINDPKTGEYDEYKVFLGFNTGADAISCFRQHYDEPSKFYRSIDRIPMWKFREKVWIKKHTQKKLVASVREAALGANRLRESGVVQIDTKIDGIPISIRISSGSQKSQLKGKGKTPTVEPLPAGMYASGSLTREVDQAGRGTDQRMKRSILGHHQDQMIDPQTRESEEGGPGSGPKKMFGDRHDAVGIVGQHAKDVPKKTWIEKAGATYKGSQEHPKGGELHYFNDPKTGSTLAMHSNDIHSEHDVIDHMQKSREKFGKKEAQEHGVSGMKWGVRHARKDAAGEKHPQTGKSQSAMRRSLANDPKTMNMMGHVSKGQAALAHYNAQRSQQKPQQPGEKQKPPVDPKQAHNDSMNALKELGWKVAGTVANLAGVGALYDAARTVVRSPAGQKMFLHTDKNGQSRLSNDKKGKIPAGGNTKRTKTSRESRSFEDRLGSFLREAKRPKIYYARSLQHYDSAKESKDIDFLEEAYPDADIKFPKTRRHAELGMGHFHKQVDRAKEVVIRPFRKKRITAGVFSEAQHALHKGKKVRMLIDGELRDVKKLKLISGGKPGGEYARVILKKKHKKK